jgi:hypothetical protein
MEEAEREQGEDRLVEIGLRSLKTLGDTVVELERTQSEERT